MTIITESNLKTTSVTFLRDVTKPLILSEISLEAALSDIKSQKYKEQIDYLQTLDDKTYTQQKKSLPAIAFHGTFKGIVVNECFQQSSGLFCFDIDKLPPDTVGAVKTQVSSVGCVVCCFTSPSGTGLKGALRVPPESLTNDADCKRIFKQVEAFYND